MNQKMNRSVSVVIPACNEEGNIRAAIDSVLTVLETSGYEYEIHVIDDGSRDKTGTIAQEMTRTNPRINVTRFENNRGYGHAVREGIAKAAMKYFCIFPGDNDMAGDSLRDLLKEAGAEVLVITHQAHRLHRSFGRSVLSAGFVSAMNSLFGLSLQYYTGPFICQTQWLKKLSLQSAGYIIIPECLVKLIKNGTSFKAIPFDHQGRRHEASKALRMKNIISVVNDVVHLWRDIRCVSFQKSSE